MCQCIRRSDSEFIRWHQAVLIKCDFGKESGLKWGLDKGPDVYDSSTKHVKLWRKKNCYQPQACIIFSYCALIFWFLNLLYCKVVFILLIFIELWSTYGSCFINLTFESSSRIIYSSLSFPGLLFGILWQVGFHLWTFSFQWHMSIFEIFNSIMSHF